MKPQKKYKVATFDFDGTLLFNKFSPSLMMHVDDEPNYPLIEEMFRIASTGARVFVVTAREEGLEDESDIYHCTVASFVETYELPVSGIVYTNGSYKGKTLKKMGSQIHFDDDPEELRVARGFDADMDLVRVRRPRSE